MTGVYLVAAELLYRNFIVSPTSRSAAGADLLVTDQACTKAWSVQVKTNKTPSNKWLLGAHAKELNSASHVYIFVNLSKEDGGRPEYFVTKSEVVSSNFKHKTRKTGSRWYWFDKKSRQTHGEGWEIFGDSHVIVEEEI